MTESKTGTSRQETRKWGPIPNDPYKTLGVSPLHTKAEIASAYKKLADKYHPDKNPGNKEAEEWFSAISEAKDILLKPEKNHRTSHFFKDFSPPRGGTYRHESPEEERKRKHEEELKRAHEAVEAARRDAAKKAAEKRRAEEAERLKQEQKRVEEEKIRQESEKAAQILEIRSRLEKNRVVGGTLSEEEIRARKIEEIKERIAKNSTVERTSLEEEIRARILKRGKKAPSDNKDSEYSEEEQQKLKLYKLSILKDYNTVATLQKEISRKEAVLKAEEKKGASEEELLALRGLINIQKEILAVLKKSESASGKQA